MAYRITFNKAIRQQIRQLPGHIKPLAKEQIAHLSENPCPPRSKELAGHPAYYRMWLGAQYRLVWHVIEEEQVVEIEYVGPKSPELYAYLELGRPKEGK